MKPRNWIDLLVGLRDRRVDRRKAELRSASQRVLDAEVAANVATRDRVSTESTLRTERALEAGQLQAGGSTAMDLVYEARHRRRSAERIERLREHERSTRAEVLYAERVTGDLKKQLGAALAQAEVVHRAQARRTSEVVDRQAEREDEMAGEAWLAGFVARRKGR